MPEQRNLNSDRFNAPPDLFPAENTPLAFVAERKGRLIIKSPLDKETIRKAIREERDSR